MQSELNFCLNLLHGNFSECVWYELFEAFRALLFHVKLLTRSQRIGENVFCLFLFLFSVDALTGMYVSVCINSTKSIARPFFCFLVNRCETHKLDKCIIYLCLYIQTLC